VTATRLAASGKDHAEHAYAAASVAERLASAGRPCGARDPQVIRLPRIMHLATDHHRGTPVARRLALAVAGVVAPQRRGVRHADRRWPRRRASPSWRASTGAATPGPVGWVDAAGDGEFAIALRCGQVSPEGTGIRLFAGGGIVAGSDAQSDELAETARKFLPMYEALSPVDRP
jgi:menaquinone-specific isochorismate synthase